jgi:hypothetical protein
MKKSDSLPSNSIQKPEFSDRPVPQTIDDAKRSPKLHSSDEIWSLKHFLIFQFSSSVGQFVVLQSFCIRWAIYQDGIPANRSIWQNCQLTEAG